MESMFPYLLMLAAAIFLVELLPKLAVKRDFVEDVWFMKLLFRLIPGGAVIWALGQRA
jgi:hypothetical protein|tara:strand:- start:320 stop:493 length:174 start_codon:yes stop_codon:yes gene_type:complete